MILRVILYPNIIPRKLQLLWNIPKQRQEEIRMLKTFKKYVALLLVAVVVSGIMPITAVATTTTNFTVVRPTAGAGYSVFGIRDGRVYETPAVRDDDTWIVNHGLSESRVAYFTNAIEVQVTADDVFEYIHVLESNNNLWRARRTFLTGEIGQFELVAQNVRGFLARGLFAPYAVIIDTSNRLIIDGRTVMEQVVDVAVIYYGILALRIDGTAWIVGDNQREVMSNIVQIKGRNEFSLLDANGTVWRYGTGVFHYDKHTVGGSDNLFFFEMANNVTAISHGVVGLIVQKRDGSMWHYNYNTQHATVNSVPLNIGNDVVHFSTTTGWRGGRLNYFIVLRPNGNVETVWHEWDLATDVHSWEVRDVALRGISQPTTRPGGTATGNVSQQPPTEQQPPANQPPSGAPQFTKPPTSTDNGVLMEFGTTPTSRYGYRIFRATTATGDGISITDFPIMVNPAHSLNRIITFDPNVRPNRDYWFYIRVVLEEARFDNATTTLIPEILGPASDRIHVRTSAEICEPINERGFILMIIGNPSMNVNNVWEGIDPPDNRTAPIINAGRTMVPIRAIIEAMGGTAGWNANDRRIDLRSHGNHVQMWLGQRNANVNNATREMDVVPEIVNDRTLIPLRFVAEFLGAQIEWIGTHQTIIIVYELQ